MVAQLLRLRADLLAGEIRGSARRSLTVVVLGLAALVAGVFVAVQFAGLRSVDPDVARAIVVPVGSLVLFGCTVVPLTLGVGDQFDPRRFLPFGIGRRDLAVGLAVAGLVGLPVVAVGIAAAGQVVTWSASVGTLLLALLSAVLVVVTCGLLVRVASVVGAVLFPAHRVRDAGWFNVLVVVLLAIPAASLLLRSSWLVPQGSELQRVAEIAGWTPWGAAWAVPADAASGHAGAAVGKLLVALVVLGLLGLAWWAIVGRLLETVDGVRATRRYRTLGWFDRLGSSPVAAVAARALTYWGRDPRYRTSYLIIVFVPLVVIPLGVAGVPWHWTALVPLPLMALIAGFLPHNDVSYDNTAVWLHVASGAPGWSDRLGRLVPVLVVGVPAAVLGSWISAALFGDLSALPVLVGVSVGMLLIGLGLSSIVSVTLPYPTVRPGDHPFRQPQAAGIVGTVAQSTMVIGMLLFSVPAVWLAVLALGAGSAGVPWTTLTLVVGVLVGVLVLAGGVLLGGREFDRRGPDLLAAAQRN